MKKMLLQVLLLALGFTVAHAQQSPIKGKVTDESGQPLPRVTVTVKGGGASTITDALGNFELPSAGRKKTTLVITSVGYGRQEINATSGGNANITLTRENVSLNDVVVVGYGSERKSDITGASSSVGAKEIAKRPLVRLEQALQGTTAGVQVTSTNGQPGQGLDVQIRGANSITGSTQPLYVIDGNIGAGSDVNVNDVASIEVLKDAASTAIYGSRGSNGVVLITTKQGMAGKTRIDFNVWTQKAEVPRELDLMGPYDFARSVNAQDIAQGSTAPFTAQQLADFKSGAVTGTDWQKSVQQKPWVKNYQVSLSGGSDAVRYYASLQYLDQPGILINQWFKNTSFRTNLDIKASDRLNLKFFIVATLPQSHNNSYGGGLTDPWSQADQWDPTSKIRDASGNFITNSEYASIQWNPVAQALSQSVDNINTNISGSGVLSYRILNGLTFTSTDVYSIGNGYGQQLFGPGTSSYVAGSNNLGSAQTSANRSSGYLSSNYLTYKRRFGDHSISATAVFEESADQNVSTTAQAKNLSSYALGYYNLGLGSSQFTTSGYSADALISYVGRIYYSYKDKLTLSASVRTDGSSHLTQKYSTFPSIGANWNIKKEKFLENSRVFSDLKVRASYGQTGNQAVGAYSTIPLINVGGGSNQNAYYYGGGSSAASVATSLGTAVSKTLKWEDKATYDGGVDMGFLNDRLTVVLDAYTSKVTNLLYDIPAPEYLGGGNYQTNIGSLSNKGFEIAIGGTPVSHSAVRWSTNLIISVNRNKVLNLGGLDNVAAIGGNNTYNAVLKVGKPLGEFYGYKYLGTWKSNESSEAALYGNVPGDARYQDINNDTAITTADYQTLGNAVPSYTFGFVNDITYKAFTLSFMFQGQEGSHVFSETQAYLWGGLGDMKNATTEEAVPENLWSPAHQTNNPQWSNTGHNYNGSDRYIYNNSYVKLKNLLISYRVPTEVLKRAKINNLEIYVSGQNILCITPYKGYDPEIEQLPTGNAISQGQEFGVIPNPKTYTIGIRLGL